jgi:spermidine synthase
VRRRQPDTIVEQTGFGAVELVPDRDRPGGWTLMIDSTPQSYVDLDDPLYLEFDYIRWLGALADTLSPGATVPHVLHLGGGGLTLARYLAERYPAWVQRVVERDAELVALVRRVLPLRRGINLRIRVADARAVVESGWARHYDLVLTDAFDGGQVPPPLATVEFATAVSRIMRPGGRYAMNIVDGPPLHFGRGQVATLCEVFPEVCMLAEPGVLRRRRHGNLVIIASTAALPLDALESALSRGNFPARVLYDRDLVRFAAGAVPAHDATATTPRPPARLFP